MTSNGILRHALNNAGQAIANLGAEGGQLALAGGDVYGGATTATSVAGVNSTSAVTAAGTAMGTNVLMMSGNGEGGGAVSKATSPVWKSLKPYRDKTRTNGLSGKDRRFYEWDNTHGDIEVYDNRGHHLGSMDPISGQMTKPAVSGRRIDI